MDKPTTLKKPQSIDDVCEYFDLRIKAVIAKIDKEIKLYKGDADYSPVAGKGEFTQHGLHGMSIGPEGLKIFPPQGEPYTLSYSPATQENIEKAKKSELEKFKTAEADILGKIKFELVTKEELKEAQKKMGNIPGEILEVPPGTFEKVDTTPKFTQLRAELKDKEDRIEKAIRALNECFTPVLIPEKPYNPVSVESGRIPGIEYSPLEIMILDHCERLKVLENKIHDIISRNTLS